MKTIKKPTIVKALGNPPKKIEEFIGRVNSSTKDISIARMKSPKGWNESGQTPDFVEYSIVLKGSLRVKTKKKTTNIRAGQAIMIPRRTWVQYSTPSGAEYMSICVPAFSPGLAHRDSIK